MSGLTGSSGKDSFKRALDEILGEGGWRSDPGEQERIGFAAIERALATLASSDRGPAT
jgi:hypothetical protein